MDLEFLTWMRRTYYNVLFFFILLFFIHLSCYKSKHFILQTTMLISKLLELIGLWSFCVGLSYHYLEIIKINILSTSVPNRFQAFGTQAQGDVPFYQTEESYVNHHLKVCNIVLQYISSLLVTPTLALQVGRYCL